MRKVLFFILISVLSCSNKKNTKQSIQEKTPQINLVEQLDAIWIREQVPIRKRDSLGRIFGHESKEYHEFQKIYEKNHAINMKEITTLLDTNGWPDIDIIGEQGNVTICNVIQHDNNEIRIKYVPLMKQAVKDKNLAPWLLARTEDRIATEQDKPQIYGGQIKYYPETKTFNVWPIIDPANVNKRRASIGLEPIEEFLSRRRFPVEWHLDEQLKRTEVFINENKNLP